MKTSSGKKHSILNLFSKELQFITFWHRKTLSFHGKGFSLSSKTNLQMPDFHFKWRKKKHLAV